MSQREHDRERAWVQARVEQYGSIDAARPRDDFTRSAWRDLCAHYQINTKAKAASLEEALLRLAELAG